MNIRQTGIGNCPICNNPLMGAVGGPPTCFACLGSKEPRTGKTVVVTDDGTAEGKVKIQEVQTGGVIYTNNPQSVKILEVVNDRISITLTLEELEGDFSIVTMLDRIYDAIDNLPPGATLKETKRLIALQDKIKNLRFKKEKA